MLNDFGPLAKWHLFHLYSVSVILGDMLKLLQGEGTMKRIFKILLVLVLAVVITLILAAVLMPMIYDKEDLKKTIASEVQKQTGRELSIDGTLEPSPENPR